MKKIIISAIILMVILAIIGGLYLALSAKNKTAANIETTSTGQAGSLPTTQVATTTPASQAYPNLPTGPELSIGTAQGTVSVNNFYAANPPVGDYGTIIIKQTENYLITYDSQTSEFWLAITGTPFATWQTTAEQDFLATLGISKADACKLSVTSGVIYSPGDPNDGKSFPLSFCTAASAFQSK